MIVATLPGGVVCSNINYLFNNLFTIARIINVLMAKNL